MLRIYCNCSFVLSGFPECLFLKEDLTITFSLNTSPGIINAKVRVPALHNYDTTEN